MGIDPFFGSVLAAAGNFFGGLMGQQSQSDANERMANEAALNRRLQDEVNRRGLTMRADDAMNAYKLYGIHPLAMLGVQGPTYSPVTTAFMGGSPMGEGLAKAGQDISRGLHATADRELKEVANKLAAKQLENATVRGGLENELLRIQIMSGQQRLTQTSSPTVPRPGVDDTWVKDDAFAKRVRSADPSHGPMRVPSVEWSRNSDGSYSPLQSKSFHDRAEDDFWQGTKHFVSNTIRPMVDPRSVKAPHDAPPGKQWYVDFKGDWKLVDVPPNDPRWSGMRRPRR